MTDDFTGHGKDDLESVLAADRLLDDLARGGSGDDDRLSGLLASAAREARAEIPAPPTLGDLFATDGDDHGADGVDGVNSADGDVVPFTAAATEQFSATTGAESTDGVDSADNTDDTDGDVVPFTAAGRGRRGPRSVRRVLARRVAASGVSATALFVAGGAAAAIAFGGLGYAAYTGSIPVPGIPSVKDDDAGTASTSSTSAGTSTPGAATGQAGDPSRSPRPGHGDAGRERGDGATTSGERHAGDGDTDDAARTTRRTRGTDPTSRRTAAETDPAPTKEPTEPTAPTPTVTAPDTDTPDTGTPDAGAGTGAAGGAADGADTTGTPGGVQSGAGADATGTGTGTSGDSQSGAGAGTEGPAGAGAGAAGAATGAGVAAGTGHAVPQA
ncbi:hypothetical protein MTQ22_00985 [Corynebacterium bovis]|uniref:hypothetical protein n=1 Tax=Corynebacterium bovis TaxID=36808 RepID=UPI0031387212